MNLLRLWNRFLLWLFRDFKGCGPEDAWFMGSFSHYSRLIVSAGAAPYSYKGWLLFAGLGVYIFGLYMLVLDGYISEVAYVLLSLPAIRLFYFLAAPKIWWMSKEQAKELSRWGKWPGSRPRGSVG